MASVPQSSWFCIQRPINNGLVSSHRVVNPRNCSLKTSASSSNAESSPPQSEKSAVEQKQSGADPVKLAFEKAKAYKKTKQSNPTPKIVQKTVSVSESVELGNGNDGSSSDATKNAENEEIPLSFRVAMAAEKDNKSKRVKSDVISAIENGGEQLESITANNGNKDGPAAEQSKTSTTNIGNKEVPPAVKLTLANTKEYKKSEGVEGGDENAAAKGSQTVAGNKGGSAMNSGNALFGKIATEKEKLKISSTDFMGLGFADKKNRGLPPGLIPVSESFPVGDLPEVEILVGDSSKFKNATDSKPNSTEEKESDIYKPKVSTWGVFPRPSDISKTYGGGRVIRPGEVLETAEDKAAKQKRTREQIAAYEKRTGLNIDPKLKSECEKSLNDGDSLMDIGRLKEALPFFEKVMDSLPFQSELHGLAALQWSICQDSLCRRDEARGMYEKLQTHPVVRVRKEASTLLFGFQAMEMLRLKNTNLSQMDTGYRNYFEAFVEDKIDYTFEDSDENDSPTQTLPFVIFLLSPIVVVLLLAIQKRI